MIVGTSDLATALGLTPRRINQLAADGLLVKVGPGLFGFKASAKAYIASLQEKAEKASGQLDLKQQQARHAKERADAMALKNQQLREELVAATDVETGWQEVCTRIKTTMLAVPLTLRSKMPNLTDYDVDVIGREINDALAELE